MALANILICWLLVSGVVTLAARKAIERRGMVLAAVLHVLVVFVAYNLALPAGANIRVDLFVTLPLLVVIIGWGVVHASRRRAQDDEPAAQPTPLRKSRRPAPRR